MCYFFDSFILLVFHPDSRIFHSYSQYYGRRKLTNKITLQVATRPSNVWAAMKEALGSLNNCIGKRLPSHGAAVLHYRKLGVISYYPSFVMCKRMYLCCTCMLTDWVVSFFV